MSIWCLTPHVGLSSLVATIDASFYGTTVVNSHANRHRVKLPVWRVSTSGTMGGEVFSSQESLTFATLDEYGF